MTRFRRRTRRPAALLGALLVAIAAAGAGEGGAAQRSVTLELEGGLGYDDNAFLGPRASYVDPIADATIEPRRKSGFFLPVDAGIGVSGGVERLELFADAGVELKRFLDPDLKNADTTRIELAGGLELLLHERAGRRDTLRLRPTARWWRQISFDRDTGEERASRDDEDQGDKSDYFRYGAEARLRERTLPVRVELTTELARYDYTEVPALDSLDAVLSSLAAEVELDAPAGAWVTVSGELARRDFDDRRSRNLEGNLVRGSDRTYTSRSGGVALSAQPRRGWTATLGYERQEREDAFAGYLDYGQDRLSARLAHRGARGLRLRAEASWWRRDYPRAFAFDDPAFARLSYETWEAELRGEIALRGDWKLRLEYGFTRQSSTDPRYDYGRHVVVAAVAAEF